MYAKKGEFITCENGCKMFEFIRDVSEGEVIDLPNQIKWVNKEMPEPAIGSVIEPCSCGAEYYKICVVAGMVISNQFHFKEGWK